MTKLYCIEFFHQGYSEVIWASSLKEATTVRKHLRKRGAEVGATKCKHLKSTRKADLIRFLNINAT